LIIDADIRGISGSIAIRITTTRHVEAVVRIEKK
jgi:hypothetical protein